METEHSENERMHRLLGGALDDVDLDANVVPAVLAGYDRGVRTRRYQAAGAALAVLAVTVGTATLLPRSGSGTTRPATSTTGKPSETTAPVIKKPAVDLSRCAHERWARMYSDGMTAPSGTLSEDPAAEQADCRALLSAFAAVFPDATITPAYFGVLELDPRVDQSKVKQDRAKDSAPDLMRDTGTEQLYLSTHPDDPANVYQTGGGTIVTPAGRESFGVYVFKPAAGDASPADCDTVTADCTPIAGSGGWHGALTSKTAPMDTVDKTAILTDGHGNFVRVTFNGKDSTGWYTVGAYAADGGAGDPNRGKWINRWTGKLAPGNWPPATPALTDAQWLQLLESTAFHTYLDSFVKYHAKLPADPLH
ncbi:hypothetical protein [Catenulispora subtropica]|uniref:Uncharacterized protein n=1 Tax=Catenulispora subtropica TaxID=450798 RepID=A0ABP5BU63_9ACTN